MTILRPYQATDADRVEAALREHRRVVYVLPTGGGKTQVAVEIARREVLMGGRVLFFAHRRELVAQARERLAEAGVPADRVQVATVQALDVTREPPMPATLVIVDEAHRAPAESYGDVLAGYPDARVLGLTATPWRMDGRGLGDTFAAMVEGPTCAELVAQGYLMLPIAYSVPDEQLPDVRGVRRRGGDYVIGDLAKAVNSQRFLGNKVEHYRRHAAGRVSIDFCIGIEHARVACADWCAAGIRAEVVIGKTPEADRQAIYARARSGETEIIVTCEVLTEGWDFVDLGGVILSRPTLSTRLHLQMLGRCMRPSPRGLPVVLDHVGNVAIHGMPDDIREYSLAAKKGTFVARGGGRDGPPKYKRCASCDAMVAQSATTCPRCGAAGLPMEIAGTLVEVAREAIRCDYEGCEALATNSSARKKRCGQTKKAFCKDHPFGASQAEREIRCDYGGCEALATNSSARKKRYGGTKKAFCKDHPLGLSQADREIRCDYGGCEALVTGSGARNKRCGGTKKAFCKDHPFGVSQADREIRCDYEGCKKFVPPQMANQKRNGHNKKTFCKAHTWGRPRETT